jgi:putative ABC transport system substrate-binding protein
LTAANKLPSIGAQEYAQAGRLIGYGVDLLGLYRRAPYFIDKILKGAKLADLPIEQPTRFELVFKNRQNARPRNCTRNARACRQNN